MSGVWVDGARRRVLVLTGTDVHPFDRICAWADDRARSRIDEQIVVQHGYTPAPRAAGAVMLLTPEELRVALETADAVVTHGGPGTISTVRAAGHEPIIFPRDPAHGEHVDEHQLRFAGWAQDRGLGVVVRDVSRLDAAVDTASRTAAAAAGSAPSPQRSLDALANLMRELADGRGRRRSLPLLRRARWLQHH